jgi:hypothetical protein
MVVEVNHVNREEGSGEVKSTLKGVILIVLMI